MRALLLPLLLLAPLAAADTEQGATTGWNLGVLAPGLWDVYQVDHPGSATFSLTWEESVAFPFADYDLRLYRPGAFDDQYLEPRELVAASEQHPYAHHSEAFSHAGPAGRYWLAVVPFQAQMETYTVYSSARLAFSTTAVGYTQE